MSTINYIELAVTIIAFLLLFGYQALRLVRLRRNPLATSLGISNQIRTHWVEEVMDQKKEVLAIQTLRNWTMAATFLASTAILIGLAFLNFAVTTEQLPEIANITNLYGSHNASLFMAKNLTLIVLFMFTFYNFTLAVRYYNHVGFMINVQPIGEAFAYRRRVCDRLNQGALHYNLGMNGFYTTIPTVLWILGPGWLLLSAIVITTMAYRLDRVERMER